MGVINLILSVLAVYAVAGAAAPVDGASGSVLVARAETSIDMCDNSRFNGDCKKLTVTTGSCCTLFLLPTIIDHGSSRKGGLYH